MTTERHTIESPDGAAPGFADRVVIGVQIGVANAAGGAAGAAVTTAISGLSLPPNYTVLVNPGQDATWYVSGKTAAGFNVTLNPRLATATLAAGTFDLVIVA